MCLRKDKYIVVNASFLQWGKHVIPFNLGDDLNYYLFNLLTGKHVVSYNDYFHKRSNNILAMGSLVDWLANEKSTIWGSGVMNNLKVPSIPNKVLAVRGPLTREYLLSYDVKCPEVYGDPALLLSIVLPFKIENNRVKIGLIPHYKDLYDNEIHRLKSIFGERLEIIKFQNYKDWRETIRTITQCDFVLSSSLHGLIISDSYGIPNCRIIFSNKIAGGDFKFNDYFLSVGRPLNKSLDVSSIKSFNQIMALKANYKKIEIDLKPLINNCPFRDIFIDQYKKI